MRYCQICQKEIPRYNSRTAVCRGTYENGVFHRSECDLERRRRHKADIKHQYRKGGRHYKEKPLPEGAMPEGSVVRYCLKCDIPFASVSKGNRLCGVCGVQNERIKGRVL